MAYTIPSFALQRTIIAAKNYRETFNTQAKCGVKLGNASKTRPLKMTARQQWHNEFKPNLSILYSGVRATYPTNFIKK